MGGTPLLLAYSTRWSSKPSRLSSTCRSVGPGEGSATHPFEQASVLSWTMADHLFVETDRTATKEGKGGGDRIGRGKRAWGE